MSNRLLGMTCILALSVAAVGASSIQSRAETPLTTVDNMNPPGNRGRFPLKSSASAVKRDVGPSSTIIGDAADDPRGNSNSGLPRVPGAPSAGSTGLGSH